MISRVRLIVRRIRLSAVGDREFPVAAARTWNSLPQHFTSACSVFRARLKTLVHLLTVLSMTAMCPRSDSCHSEHLTHLFIALQLRLCLSRSRQTSSRWHAERNQVPAAQLLRFRQFTESRLPTFMVTSPKRRQINWNALASTTLAQRTR